MFRKGCRPNAIVKLCIKDKEMFCGVFAIKNIAIKDEIVVEYDNSGIEKNCTCVNMDFCLNPNFNPENKL